MGGQVHLAFPSRIACGYAGGDILCVDSLSLLTYCKHLTGGHFVSLYGCQKFSFFRVSVCTPRDTVVLACSTEREISQQPTAGRHTCGLTASDCFEVRDRAFALAPLNSHSAYRFQLFISAEPRCNCQAPPFVSALASGRAEGCAHRKPS